MKFKIEEFQAISFKIKERYDHCNCKLINQEGIVEARVSGRIPVYSRGHRPFVSVPCARNHQREGDCLPVVGFLLVSFIE